MEDVTKSALEIIGKNIKTARLMRGLSQESLAEKLDKSVNFVSLLENRSYWLGSFQSYRFMFCFRGGCKFYF